MVKASRVSCAGILVLQERVVPDRVTYSYSNWDLLHSMSEADPTTAVIVSDSTLVMEGLRSMLAPFSKQVNVIGAVLGEIPRIEADIILLDAFGHPDAGIDRIKEAKAAGTFSKVALLVWQITETRIQRAVEVGAAAVLSKSSDAANLVASIEKAVAGDTVIDQFPNQSWTDRWLEGEGVHLTPREVQLLTLLASGLTNREIASVMFIAESSAKTYLKRIYKKLKVTNRAQATLRAVEYGLAGPDFDHVG